jgi:hypothetical protein
MLCSHCGVEQPDDSLECLACGVVFAKLRRRGERTRPAPRASAADVAGGPPPDDDTGAPLPHDQAAEPPPDDEDNRWRRLLALLTHVEPEVNPLFFGGRVFVYCLFVVCVVRFLSYPVASSEMMGSFLHAIDIVFHEAGHVVLMPLGWSFLTALGGSLGQIAIPLICAGTLLLRARDPFGASIGLWWTGQSFMDLAPYIGDARALQLPLLGGATGAEVEGHDWEAILTALGWLGHDRTLAALAHAVGALLIVVSLVWGGYVLARQRKRLAPGRRPAPG